MQQSYVRTSLHAHLLSPEANSDLPERSVSSKGIRHLHIPKRMRVHSIFSMALAESIHALTAI